MDNTLLVASRMGLYGNIFLFILKMTAGIFSNSISVISDAFNSLADILSSIAVHISIKLSTQQPDEDHPFGHNRAEPLAGLLVAIMAAILGFSVISTSIGRLLSKNIEEITLSPYTFTAIFITIITKGIMTVYFHNICKNYDTPAIKACEIDSRNDVLVSAVALVGITGVKFNIYGLDAIMGSFIGLQIIHAGYEVGKRNIDFLIGKAPDQTLINQIMQTVDSVNEIISFHDIRAHYVGNIVQVEIHILLDNKLNLLTAHNIGKEVQRKVEQLPSISKAFIHIDPI